MAIEKSKAEQYRDERKARIADAAKKNAKDMQKKNATKKLAKRIVSIVLIAAIALGAVGVALNYYGVWDRTVKAGSIGDAGKFSLAEYEYYYWAAYNNLISSISQQQYNSSGYDTSKPPHEQTSMTEDAEGNPITWVESLRQSALDSLQAQRAIYNEAEKAGKATLTEEEQKQVDETVEAWREQAESEQYKMTLNAYLRMTYGEYMNEKFLRTIIERETIVTNYVNFKFDEIKNSYDKAKIDEVYNKDKNAYDMVDFRIYEFAKETLKAEQGEAADDLAKRQKAADEKTKKDAEAFLAAVTDEASFVTKAKELNKDDKEYDVERSTKMSGVLKSESANISADCSEWLFKAETKVGDKKLFESKTGDAYYVVLMTAKPHQVDTVSVRHILFANSDATTGAKLTDAEIAKKKSSAEEALKKWQSGEKTAESFGALATELTEDTGSASTGGLYENVRPGQMVPEFDAWIFDKNRKPGDTGIVETDYGYHVMYFQKNEGKYYESAIKNTIAQEDANTAIESIVGSDAYALDPNDTLLKYAEKQMNNHIADMIAQQSASQQQYSYY